MKSSTRWKVRSFYCIRRPSNGLQIVRSKVHLSNCKKLYEMVFMYQFFPFFFSFRSCSLGRAAPKANVEGYAVTRFKDLGERLKSYNSWPHLPIPKDDLSASGFYYTGNRLGLIDRSYLELHHDLMAIVCSNWSSVFHCQPSGVFVP
jgi:hypothetical protein